MISHYRLIDKIGEGGMGVVWKALDTKLEREVALKLLPSHMASDSDLLARLEREAKAAAALNHPNIVTLYSVEDVGGKRFITMELVRGTPLQDILASGALTLDRFMELAIPLADAVSCAHEQGITHRDLKPSNIMVTPTGQPKVLDFGLAKSKRALSPAAAGELTTETVTAPGHILGTIPYMSPEQVQGTAVDPRTDLFSLGVLFYEMSTGARPFAGANPAALISSILKDSPPSVNELKQDLPFELGRIVQRCLEKDRDKRYQTASNLRSDLESLKTELATGQVQARQREQPGAPARARAARVAQVAVPILAAVAVGVYLLQRLMTESGDAGSTTTDSPVSVAVLPFDSLNDAAEDEYFAHGLAEELINALVQVDGLRVPARNSAFAFSDKDVPLSEIAEKLGVENLVHGSIRRSDDKIRVTARLVSGPDGFQTWSQNYTRDLQDVFALQEDLARAIVQQLRVQLSEDDASPIVSRPTENWEAYNLYQQANYFWRKRNEPSLERALTLFQQAIEIDSSFALAYVGWANAYGALQTYGSAPRSEERRQRSIAMMRKAIEIDDSLPEAHAALGRLLRGSEGVQELRRALDLNPNYAEAHQWLSSKIRREDPEESLFHLRRAEELDPVSLPIKALLAYANRCRGDFGMALQKAKSALELDPNFATAHVEVAEAYVGLRLFDQAREALVAKKHLGEFRVGDWALLANILHLQANHELELLEATQMRAEHGDRWVSLRWQTTSLAALGRGKEALRLFEEALSSDAAQADGPTLGQALWLTATEMRAHGDRATSKLLAQRYVVWLQSQENPAGSFLHDLNRVFAHLLLDDADTARSLFEASIANSRVPLPDFYVSGVRGCLAALSGDREGALQFDEQLGNLKAQIPPGGPAYHRAAIAACLEDRQRAVALLRDALVSGLLGRFPGFFYYSDADPFFESLWSFAPYLDLLREMGLQPPTGHDLAG